MKVMCSYAYPLATYVYKAGLMVIMRKHLFTPVLGNKCVFETKKLSFMLVTNMKQTK